MSYAIPTNELTVTDIKQYKAAAIAAGISTALASGIAKSAEGLVVREGFPRTDYGTAATGWVNENYITAAIAAINAWASAFSNGVLPASAVTLARTKVAVFYKFADTMAQPVVTATRFRLGANGSSTMATFFTQLPTQAKLEPDIYFSEPVVYQPEDVIYVEIYNTAVIAVGETIPYGSFIVERIGPNVS